MGNPTNFLQSCQKSLMKLRSETGGWHFIIYYFQFCEWFCFVTPDWALCTDLIYEPPCLLSCHSTIAEEQVKFKQWRTENVRRKHDFVPLALNLMKVSGSLLLSPLFFTLCTYHPFIRICCTLIHLFTYLLFVPNGYLAGYRLSFVPPSSCRSLLTRGNWKIYWIKLSKKRVVFRVDWIRFDSNITIQPPADSSKLQGQCTVYCFYPVLRCSQIFTFTLFKTHQSSRYEPDLHVQTKHARMYPKVSPARVAEAPCA